MAYDSGGVSLPHRHLDPSIHGGCSVVGKVKKPLREHLGKDLGKQGLLSCVKSS